MFELFYDLYQDSKINRAQYAAERGEQTAQSARDAVRQLEERVNKLTLINMALWSLLKETAGLTEEALAKRVEEIDLADGQIDGRMRPRLQACPQCAQTLSQRHNRCLYCGYAPDETGVFGGVAR